MISDLQPGGLWKAVGGKLMGAGVEIEGFGAVAQLQIAGQD